MYPVTSRLHQIYPPTDRPAAACRAAPASQTSGPATADRKSELLYGRLFVACRTNTTAAKTGRRRSVVYNAAGAAAAAAAAAAANVSTERATDTGSPLLPAPDSVR